MPIFIPAKKKIIWGHSGLCPWKIPIYNRPAQSYWTKDSDGDKVLDAFDCQPFNKRKQGSQHKDPLKKYRYKSEEEFFSEIEKKYPDKKYAYKKYISPEKENIVEIKGIKLSRPIHSELFKSPINISQREFERKWDKAKAIEKLKQKEYEGISKEKHAKKIVELVKESKKERLDEEAKMKHEHELAWKAIQKGSDERSKRAKELAITRTRKYGHFAKESPEK